MIRYFSLLALFIPLISVAADINGLCNIKESNFFSCQVSKKRWISLCGDQSLGLQYRFGDTMNKEFIFPLRKNFTSFKIAHYSRARADYTEVSFENKNVRYSIFEYFEDNSYRSGVRVDIPSEKEVEFSCKRNIISRLKDLENLLACDKSNALSINDCKQE